MSDILQLTDESLVDELSSRDGENEGRRSGEAALLPMTIEITNYKMQKVKNLEEFKGHREETKAELTKT